LAQRALPTIIFDYAQGFELDTLDDVYKKYVKVSEYRIGEEGISLNPLQIFPKDIKGPASVATRLSDVFDAVYHLGHIQRKVLIEAILSTFERTGILTTPISASCSRSSTIWRRIKSTRMQRMRSGSRHA
jgi:hypothetical protein